MTADALLAQLRTLDPEAKLAAIDAPDALKDEWLASGVRFTATDPGMEAQHDKAVAELMSCIKIPFGEKAILQEGGVYLGCWLESTGTINTELLSRFLPSIAQNTYEAFAEYAREDGLFPYKITADGPVYNQIQTVTPLARCVWNHYLLHGRDRAFLEKMYAAMSANDAWLAAHRDTRGTGAVEAFCCYDTGHDLSPRFWHVPDSPYQNDPARYDPDNPLLPFIAPDLTANVACQRRYFSRMAEVLDEPADWEAKAQASETALFAQCWDDRDAFFYDLMATDDFVRIQSDNLLRVLACEIGDANFFDAALRRYLLNTRKFFARFPFTSIAMDDPRFDPAFAQNSWGGPSNFLSIIRSPHAFEHHHRFVELGWVMQPILFALNHFTEFTQTVAPFTGAEGYTKAYSPTILCLLDFTERLSGILPRPEETLWFTGLTPKAVERRDAAHATGYGRCVDGHYFELVNTLDTTTAYCDGEMLFEAPSGLRVVADRSGNITGLIGMTARQVEGTVQTPQASWSVSVGPNERLQVEGEGLVSIAAPSLVPVTHG